MAADANGAGMLGPRVPPVLAAAIVAFFVALALRLVFVLDAHDSPFLTHRLIDEQDYHGLAQGFLHGQWPGREALFRPPLYPMFLATARVDRRSRP